MSITTDSYKDVISGGITYDRIGLSKTINNYTFDNLFENAYCGQYDISRLNNHLSQNDVSFTSGNNLWNYSVTYSNNKWSEGGDVGNYSDPDGLYGKVIWLQCDSTFDNSVTVTNFHKYKLVTEWDAPKYCADAPALNAGPCSSSLVPDNWNTDKPFPAIYYAPGDIVLSYRSHLTYPDDVSIVISDIRPYMICKFNDVGFIYRFDMNDGMHYFYGANSYYGSPDLFAVGGITSFDTTYSLAEAMSCDYMSPQISGYNFSGYPNDSVFPLTLPLGSTGTTNKGMISADQRYIVKLTTGGTYVGMYAGVEFRSYFTRRHDALMFYANMGIKFYAGPRGKHYKPIIENGIVIDFSENLEDPSELDNWTGSTAHDVPDAPTPPTPPTPSDDDYTDMDLGVSNITLGGLTKYAILTKSELVGLIADYNGNASMAGSNFSNHIICLYRLGFPASSIATTTTGKIVMVRSAGDVDFTSQANTYNLVSKQTVFIDAGGILVPRMTNTFYDFSPYSSYELYIPGCGWIPLPDNVAGRNIHVYIVFDLPTCSAKGIVRIAGGVYGGTTIATVNGIIGASCPFTIGENGQQRAAVMSANAQVAAGIATGIVGATVNPMMAVAGGAELLSGLIGAYTAGNTNYVSTKGGAADFSMFGDGGRAVLKINSPVIDSVVNNSDFGHTVGYMCNEVGQLSNFHGFTVCANPHVHISATSTEKEEIKRLLEEGVILP